MATDFEDATHILTKSTTLLEQAAALLVEAMGFDYIPRLMAEAQTEVDAAGELAARWPQKGAKAARHAKALLSSLKFQANSAFARIAKIQVLYEEVNAKADSCDFSRFFNRIHV